MAKSNEVLLAEFARLQKQPGFDQLAQDAWFGALESEEQLNLWAAFNESKAREERYNAACGIKKG